MPRAALGCQKIGTEIIVIGGCEGYGSCRSTTEIYSSESDTWTPGPEIPSPIPTIGYIHSSIQFLPGEDTFVVYGGFVAGEVRDTIMKFDPVNREFVVLEETLQTARSTSVLVHVPATFACG